MAPRPSAALLALALALLAPACSTQYKARGQVSYEFIPGKTLLLRPDGQAVAPRSAPSSVKRAVAAANRINGKPYRWGGGHARHDDSGYDCSGATSYVLREAGLLKGSMPSSGFLHYGNRGPGRWIDVYTQRGHVFLVIGGLRFDTGGSKDQRGPRWQPAPRRVDGFYIRHPPGA